MRGGQPDSRSTFESAKQFDDSGRAVAIQKRAVLCSLNVAAGPSFQMKVDKGYARGTSMISAFVSCASFRLDGTFFLPEIICSSLFFQFAAVMSLNPQFEWRVCNVRRIQTFSIQNASPVTGPTSNPCPSSLKFGALLDGIKSTIQWSFPLIASQQNDQSVTVNAPTQLEPDFPYCSV